MAVRAESLPQFHRGAREAPAGDAVDVRRGSRARRLAGVAEHAVTDIYREGGRMAMTTERHDAEYLIGDAL